MQVGRAIWLLVAVHLLAGTYGFALNDEADQIAAFYNLAHGSLLVKEVPPSAYQLQDNISWLRRWDDRPIASTPLNLLALPVFAAIRLASAIAPLSVWFSGIATIGLWRAAGRPAPWRSPPGVWGAAVLFGSWAFLAQGMRALGPDLDYYGATVALNVTSILLGILGSVLAWHALGRHAKPSWRPLLLAALLLGPWLYWARLAKYHMLGAVTMLGIIMLLQRPATWKRDFAVGVLAGFALWVNFGIGVVAILGLASLKLVTLLRAQGQRRQAMRTWVPLIVGGLIGLAPVMAENTYLFGNPFINFYFASPETSTGIGHTTLSENETGAAGGNPVWASLKAIPAIFAHLMHWNGPLDFLKNLASTFTLGTRVEGLVFGIFLISPILALALVGMWRLARGPERPPDVAWAAAVLGWQAALGTNAGVMQGAGFDARLWFHLLPLLAILAAFGVRKATQELRPWRVLAGAGAFAATVFIAIWAIGQSGHRLGTPSTVPRFVMYGTFILGTILVGLSVAWSIFKRSGRTKARATTMAMAAALAMPLVWGGLFMLVVHPHLPDSGSHQGGSFFIPVMGDVSSIIHGAVFPPAGLPMVWDGNGTLVFHPDYGSCLVNPNPCPDVPIPEDLRQRMENATVEPTTTSTEA
ncbi:MAG: hypothetical protein AABY18_02775 [Candidatus Thermoplasmatota archaeon]